MAIIDFFDRGRRRAPGAVAYVCGERSWTFDEAGELSCRISHALARAGCGRGTKAGVLSPNDARAWIGVLGIWRAGAAWVPLNPTTPPADLRRAIDAFDCEVLFFHSSTASVVAGLAPSLPKIRQYVCLDAAAAGAPSLAEWTHGLPATPPRTHHEMDDVVAISSTGGTTGAPKGVMNTHRSLSTCLAHLMMAFHYEDQDPVVDLAALPLSHASGVISLAATARGGTVVFLPGAEPTAILDAIERHRVTELFLAPTVVYRLMETPGLTERDLSSLRYLLYAAAPMSAEKLRRAIELFGPVLMECYGQVEAFAGVSFMRPDEHFTDGAIAPDARLTSCGRPYPLVSVEIRDGEGRQVPAGGSGEVCVRGDLVMKGYYADPERTAETVVDGWLHTGDIGHFDADGYLFITDRKKDMIISGGVNIYPSEIEQVIWGHPAVQDCAVIGVPHDDWGEAVTAVVEPNPGARPSGEELIALCKKTLGSIRAPKRVDFVTALPRSANGKVLKRAVRERYWTGRTRQV